MSAKIISIYNKVNTNASSRKRESRKSRTKNTSKDDRAKNYYLNLQTEAVVKHRLKRKYNSVNVPDGRPDVYIQKSHIKASRRRAESNSESQVEKKLKVNFSKIKSK